MQPMPDSVGSGESTFAVEAVRKTHLDPDFWLCEELAEEGTPLRQEGARLTLTHKATRRMSPSATRGPQQVAATAEPTVNGN